MRRMVDGPHHLHPRRDSAERGETLTIRVPQPTEVQ